MVLKSMPSKLKQNLVFKTNDYQKSFLKFYNTKVRSISHVDVS